MTNSELLVAISEVFEEKLKEALRPVKEDIKELKQDMRECMENHQECLEECYKHKVNQETLATLHLKENKEEDDSIFDRYEVSMDEYEKLKRDLELLKIIIIEHDRKIRNMKCY